MATTQLRPMAMGEILDASFALLRRHAGVFFGVAIVCQGLPTALGLFVEFNGGARQHFGLYALSQLLSFIGYLLITGASIRVVSQAYLGNEPSLSDALDFAFSKLGRTLAAGFAQRSEEHTSELQSRLHLVCRLLLEKKKKKRENTKNEQRIRALRQRAAVCWRKST